MKPTEIKSNCWLDVSDLLVWEHATGIQRVLASIATEFLKLRGEGAPIRFVNFLTRVGFVEVSAEAVRLRVEALIGLEYLRKEEVQKASSRQNRVAARLQALSSWTRCRLRALRAQTYTPLSRALEPRLEEPRDGISSRLRSLGKSFELWCLRRVMRANRMFRPGDVLLNIGSTWWQPSYPEILDEIRNKTELHFVLLVHDVIPWRAPQFCTTATVADFVPWMRRIMPSAAKLLTISSCSRTDILAFLKAFDIPEKEVAIIRWGRHRSGDRHETSAAELLRPPAGFVLSVGTVEARKNHILLVRVWSMLLERHDPSLIPQLVWAGRQGWMIDALLRRIAETNFIGGKLVWLGQKDGLPESALRALYRDCLFTMFPSFYEGWGLPVSESLAYGKFCIASIASAIPEAGGDLVDYHAPEDLAKCLELTERAIFDPAYRAARERRIRREFQMPSWADSAQRLMKECKLDGSRGRERV